MTPSGCTVASTASRARVNDLAAAGRAGPSTSTARTSRTPERRARTRSALDAMPGRERAGQLLGCGVVGLARGQRPFGLLQRPVGPAASLDPDAAQRTSQRTDHRRVEHLLLAEEAERPAGAGDGDADRGGVEVAPVVGHDDAGPFGRDVLD